MLIQKETIEKIVPTSSEYKLAVKSVIQWQIQALLQKLALETGDESIIISTNVSKGTYNHYGSFLGKEFLEKDDPLLPSICTNFFKFCTGLQKDTCSPFLSAGDQAKERTSKEDAVDGENSHNILIGQPRVDFSQCQQQQLIQDAQERGQNQYPVSTTQQKSGALKQDESIANASTTATTTKMDMAMFNEIEIDDREIKAEKETVNESFSKEVKSSIPPLWIKIEPNDDIQINEVHSEFNLFPTSKVTISNINNASGSVSKSPYIPLASIQKRNMAPKSKHSDHSPDVGSLSFTNAEGLSKTSSTSIENIYMDVQENFDSDPNFQPNSHEVATLVSDQSKMYVVHKKQKTRIRFSREDGRLLYVCQICGRDLSNHASLNRHMLTHDIVKPFRCLLCGKFYIRKYQVREHIQKHHKGEDPKKYYSRLLPKIKGVSGAKNIPSCQAESSSLTISRLNFSDHSVSMDEFSVEENQLDESKDAHFEIRPEVEVQELSSDSDHSLSTLKKSVQSTESATAEDTASGQFMLAPPSLKKQDISSYCLSEDQQDPDDSVDFNQSSFINQNSSGRVRHMPKKRGRKPQNKVLVLYCDICNKDFNHPSSYYRHLHLHDTKPPFKCQDCGKGFIRKYVYRAHMVSEHGMTLNDEKHTKV